MSEPKKNAARLDAAELVYFTTNQLEAVKVATYDEKLIDPPYSKYLPVTSTVSPNADTMSWLSYKGYGLAKFISSYSKDFPRADIGATKHTISIKDIGEQFGYSIREIRASAEFGLQLDVRKAKAARRAIEEKLDSVAWVGDADHGIQGFIKYPGTTEFTVPNTGTGTTKTWSTKTPDQIITDLNGMVNTTSVLSYGKEEIDTILLPRVQMNLLRNTRVGTSSDITIYEFWTRNNPTVRLEILDRLSTAGTGGIAMMIGYKNDKDHVNFEVPMLLEQFPEEQDGLEYKVKLMSTVAGTILFYPSATVWAEGI